MGCSGRNRRCHGLGGKCATACAWMVALVMSAATVMTSTAPAAAGATSRGTPRVVQSGQASWYGHAFQGRRTASGEVYDMHGLTAAHRDLPLGSRVLVKN